MVCLLLCVCASCSVHSRHDGQEGRRGETEEQRRREEDEAGRYGFCAASFLFLRRHHRHSFRHRCINLLSPRLCRFVFFCSSSPFSPPLSPARTHSHSHRLRLPPYHLVQLMLEYAPLYQAVLLAWSRKARADILRRLGRCGTLDMLGIHVGPILFTFFFFFLLPTTRLKRAALLLHSRLKVVCSLLFHSSSVLGFVLAK